MVFVVCCGEIAEGSVERRGAVRGKSGKEVFRIVQGICGGIVGLVERRVLSAKHVQEPSTYFREIIKGDASTKIGVRDNKESQAAVSILLVVVALAGFLTRFGVRRGNVMYQVGSMRICQFLVFIVRNLG